MDDNHTNSCWNQEGLNDVPVKDECVFVERVDAGDNGGNGLAGIQKGTNVFVTRHHGGISVLVHKQVTRGNFGEKRMWDHRPATFTDENGRRVNATEELSVLGMGPYISFSVQKGHIARLPSTAPVLRGFLNPTLGSLIECRVDDEECFKLLVGNGMQTILFVRIEIEVRGEEHTNNAAHIASSVIDALQKEGIEYKFGTKRKVSRHD